MKIVFFLAEETKAGSIGLVTFSGIQNSVDNLFEDHNKRANASKELLWVSNYQMFKNKS